MLRFNVLLRSKANKERIVIIKVVKKLKIPKNMPKT